MDWAGCFSDLHQGAGTTIATSAGTARPQKVAMLGLVFTELMEMVEDHFSPAMADAVLQDARLSNDGAYTAVGYYDHAELMRIVDALAARSGVPADELVRVFGKHLMGRFTVLYPQFFARSPTLFDLLCAIDGHIHVEVRKLYEHASLPRFEVVERSAGKLVIRYTSPRSLQALAHGLIEGAADYYGQPGQVSLQAETGGALFTFETRA